ncbi:MAG: DNA topoisomerase VI subunit B, partial [Phycisphaerae bacterium]|nr:DNA topoisomerase VI subunit B [Phycisphaerae bacterium]
RGRQSVDKYLQQTAIANPHVSLIYHAPDGREDLYKPSVKDLPATPKEVRPHPYGVELGILIKMLQDTNTRTITQFLTGEFSRVSPRVARQILEKAGLRPKSSPKRLNGDAAKGIYEAIQDTQIMAPGTDCVVPIGQENLIAGLKHVVDATFFTATSRRPAVYRGNPFVIETAVAYGKPQPKKQNAEAEQPNPAQERTPEGDGEPASVIRFANRVPLQYQ